jgi:hypothetical protein
VPVAAAGVGQGEADQGPAAVLGPVDRARLPDPPPAVLEDRGEALAETEVDLAPCRWRVSNPLPAMRVSVERTASSETPTRPNTSITLPE